MEAQGDSIVLEEEIDPNYEPTEKEVQEYASWLGMDLETEQDLFWIAREGLKAPLPENWKPCKTTDTEEIYYFNFATGQSTWDHPCDEYYRKVYEDHKKKRSQSGRPAVEGDERKKKEKEDVAELLGKKGGKKKAMKAAAKAAAEPLGPPVLARGGSLEKKPLPGLGGGKLGRLSSGGLGSASGLRPVASLGRLKGEAKDNDGDVVEEEEEDDGEHKAPSNALSKPPLGNLLTKKPLPTASGVVKVDTKAEMDGIVSEFEQKKQKLAEEHAKIIIEMEEEHEKKVAAQTKKSKAELEELEEQDDVKVKQKRKELERKLNDIENQYDKEENNLLRERKEKLKRLETDMENALSHKKQELERDQQKELQRLETRRQARLHELREEQEKEEKLAVRKGEQIREAGELQKEIDKLSSQLRCVEDEATTLKSKCTELETENAAANKRADALHIQLETATGELQTLRTTTAPASENFNTLCEECPRKEKRIQALEEALSAEQKNLETTRGQVATLNSEIDRLRVEVRQLRNAQTNSEVHAEQNAAVEREVNALRQAQVELESALRQEKEKNAEFSRRNEEWKTKCAELENQVRESTERTIEAPREEEESDTVQQLQNEIADLQDQLAVLSKTNSQIKDQLLKESNEKKSLKEQLDEVIAKKETDTNLRQVEHTDAERTIGALQSQLSEETMRSERHEKHIRELQESARLDKAAAEQDAHRREGELSRCITEKASLEGEIQILKKQLQEKIAHTLETSEQAEQQAKALVTQQKWEIEQLHSQLGVAKRESDELSKRVENLQNELQVLTEAKYQIEAEKDGEILKAKKKEAEKDTMSLRVKALQEDLDAQVEKTRVATGEAADLKSQLTKMKYKEQACADRITQQEEEIKILEAKVQEQHSDIERLTRDVRQKSSQLEEKLVSLVEAQSENESLTDQIAETKKQVNELRLKAQVSGASHGSTSGGAGELSDLRQRLSEQDEKLDSLSSERIQLVEKQRQMTQKLHSLESSLSSVQAERDHLVEECERKDQDLVKWRDRFDKKSKETEQVKAELSRLNSEKEIAELALTKEKDEKKDTTNQKAHLEKARRHLETTIESLTLQLHEAETAKSRAVLDTQAQQNKLKRLDEELEKLGRDLRATQEDRDNLYNKINQQGAEMAALENRIKGQRNENNELVTRSKSLEDDCNRQQETIKRLEGQLTDKETRLRKEGEDREALVKLLAAARSEKEELENELLQTKRKVESVEIRYKNQESAASRGDFQLKLRVQQLEAERDGILNGKERAEQLVKTIEKELQHSKEELKAIKTELESTRTRIKTLTLEKEEAETALLHAQTQAQAHSSFSNHLRPGATSADALLVRLQLADVNKSELEQHLADLASQLEVANRRCATSDSRCRDQSVEIESLHVEIASLRSAMAKMHMSALETLPLVERLEYEHRKRTLKRDWMAQLRDFQEREEHALMRQKARVRAQHERQVEELADEFESKKQRRIEYEEQVEAQVLGQLRQERDAKVKELRRQIENELLQEEQAMVERKERELERVKVEIRRDEEQERARLREEQQAKREECSVNLGTDGHDSPLQVGTSSSLRPTARRRSRSRSRSGDAGSELSQDDEDPQQTQARKSRGHRSSRSRSTKSHDCKREIAKWRQRLSDETKLLEKAKALFAEQKKQLKRQAEHVRKDKQAWKQEWAAAGEAGGHKTTILREMRTMIDQNAMAWNANMAQLRERDAWIQKRDAKLRKMRRALDSLRPRRGRSRSREAVRFASDDDDTDQSSIHSDSSENNRDYTNPSAVLAELARLDEELVFDASDASQEGLRTPTMSEQVGFSLQRQPPVRSFFSDYPPGLYWPAESVSEPLSRTYLSASAVTMRPTTTSRVYFPSRTLSSIPGTSRSNGSHYRAMSHSDTAVQRRIARWAHGREAVQQAATKQASWLSSLYEEVKAYGDAKAQSAANAAPVVPLDQLHVDDI